MEQNKQNTQEEKKAQAQDFLKFLRDLDVSASIADKVKDNKIEFGVGKETYRVRKPNYKEQKEIEKYTRKVYNDLLNDDTIQFRETIEKKLKNKGINIEAEERKIRELQQEIERLGLRALQANKAENKKVVESLKNEIIKLQLEQWGLQTYITDKLNYSLETRLLVERNGYITYIILEKKEKDQWTKAFKNYEDFMNCENAELVNKAIQYADFVVYPVDLGNKEK
jgi:ribosomal protein L17